MEERGYVLGNIDCTIIAQKPKLSPHKVSLITYIAVPVKCESTLITTNELAT